MILNVERYGTGEQVVFIHGSGGSTMSWYFQKGRLGESIETILVDLPGHGKMKGEKSFDSIDDCMKSVLETVRAIGLNRFYIAGHSMGGAVAMLFAFEHPEMLKGMILIGSGARLKVLPQILNGIREDKEGTVARIINLAFSKKAAESLKESSLKEMIKTDAQVLYNDFYACDRFDLMSSLDKIHVPTLIVCGKDDLLTPPKYSHYLADVIKGSSLVLIGDAGHMVMLEKPKEFNDAIMDFVKKTDKLAPNK